MNFIVRPIKGRSGRAYGLFLPTGEMLGTYGSKDQAWTRAEKITAAEGRIDRACLCCAQTFPSEGPHNRMCKRCR